MPLVPNEIKDRITKYLTEQFDANGVSATVSDDGVNYEVSATCTVPLSYTPGPTVINLPAGATLTITPPVE
jgi:hypothetical protein